MRNVNRARVRNIGAMAVAGFMVALGMTLGQARAFAAEYSVWSFSMWCIEMEMLPSERCAERRPDDLAAYQAYVSRTQRFEQEIADQERRQAEALDRLNRQSVNPGAQTP